MSQNQAKKFSNVWDAISDTPEEAANMAARSELMRLLAALIGASSWTQKEAADRCGVRQPRVNDLLRGRVSKFSLDALVNIAAALQHPVLMRLEGYEEEKVAAPHAARPQAR